MQNAEGKRGVTTFCCSAECRRRKREITDYADGHGWKRRGGRGLSTYPAGAGRIATKEEKRLNHERTRKDTKRREEKKWRLVQG